LRNYPDNQYKLVPAQDPEKLAEAIKAKINTQCLSREQIVAITNKISKAKMIEKTLEIYR